MKIESLADYNYNEVLDSILAGPPKVGKTYAFKTLLKGVCGEVASELIVLAIDPGSLIGLKLAAEKEGTLSRIRVINLETLAAGDGFEEGKQVLGDTLITTVRELNEQARKGVFGPLPAVATCSLTTLSEAFENEVRTCKKSEGIYNIWTMNPDKWGLAHIYHANFRTMLSQFPGHKIYETHIDPGLPKPMGGKQEDSVALTGKQKIKYPKAAAQLLEMSLSPPVPGGAKTARRYFETRANGGWTRGVRMGDERLSEQEPADFSVIACKLGLKMFKKTEHTHG